MTPSRFVEEISSLDFPDVFNPYSDQCEYNDFSCSPDRRRSSLLAILEVACECEIDSMWVGRDLGYRGGRRTGLALTDDAHFFEHAGRWEISAERPAKGKVVERTAAVIWSVLRQIEAQVFLWNVFPLHPHQAGKPFTNRSHNSREKRCGEELLFELVLMLKPRRLVPIGNDAASAAFRLSDGRDVRKVRHPSYGGQNEFRGQMREIYELDGKGHPETVVSQLELSTGTS